ncbi:peptidoglycan/xylan/chitin deacetylase (PgdA/CDA1 family) [Nakamurella sp. UYEF19]|uniref:polysaccharide deacetylase family protein n=1 Tax=Nakamurella sp. UYEF19 TaxID=1756392 RepID=UPI003399C97D
MALATVAAVVAIVAGLLLSPGATARPQTAGKVGVYAADAGAGTVPLGGTLPGEPISAPDPAGGSVTGPPGRSAAAPADGPDSGPADDAGGTGPITSGYGGDEPPVIVTVPDLPAGATEPLATLSFEPAPEVTVAPAETAATTPSTASPSTSGRASADSSTAGRPTATQGRPTAQTSVPTAAALTTAVPPPAGAASRTTPATAPARATPSLPPTSAPATSPSTVPTTTRVVTVPAHYAHPLGWVDGGKVVSLTFDDGPSQYTGQVLDVLARYGIKATFCQIGEQVGDFPAIEKRIAKEGHTVCNHTWNHDEALPSRSAPVIDVEITRTQQAIHAFTGLTPRYYRAPGGNWGRTATLKGELAKYRTIPLAWADDSLDWTTPGVTTIVKNVVSTVTPGAIILMHDGGGNRTQTLAALPKIITALRAAGYTFVVLPRNPPLG